MATPDYSSVGAVTYGERLAAANTKMLRGHKLPTLFLAVLGCFSRFLAVFTAVKKRPHFEHPKKKEFQTSKMAK